MKCVPLGKTSMVYKREAWGELSEISNAKKRFNEAEHLVHGTKKNQTRYDFDLHFPKDNC